MWAFSAAALLGACGSSESKSPATSTSALSPPSTGAPIPLSTDATAPFAEPVQSGIGATSQTTAETFAARGAITVTVGTQQFSAALSDNDTARTFANRLPSTLAMRDVNGNEKAFGLPEALPSNPENPGTVHTGDLVLYGSSTIVLFYKSFDTSYPYTRIGRLDDPDGLPEILGTGEVTVTFTQ